MDHSQRNSDVRAQIADFELGTEQPLTVIAGPCVIENHSITHSIAEKLAEICGRLPVNFVFKASFDKANRTSLNSFRGVGLEEGLKVLSSIANEFALPVTTDIHEAAQAEAVGQVCDVIQIPAFLARQTDLLVQAAATGKAVNVKKGQFMAPQDMQHVVNKLRESGCRNIVLTERGTFFGYGQLINDMRSLVTMRGLGVPVCFDATHSVQQPSSQNGTTGGQREMVGPLARAAVAVGIDALFIETHPEPAKSPSDGPNMVPLEDFESLLTDLLAIRNALAHSGMGSQSEAAKVD